MTESREHVKSILEAEVAKEPVPTELGERVTSIHRAAKSWYSQKPTCFVCKGKLNTRLIGAR
jgi:hypothetical protein